MQLISEATYSEEHKCLVDPWLEQIYADIRTKPPAELDLEDIGKKLDNYVCMLFNTQTPYAFFGNSLVDAEAAVNWASRFGEVVTWSIDKEEACPGCNGKFEAVVDCKVDPAMACGTTLSQAITLAGINVLRKVAYQVLNEQPTNQSKH